MVTEQRQEQEMRQLTSLQLSRIARANNGLIVDILADIDRQEIQEFAGRDDMTRAIVQKDVHKQALEGVIARRVIRRHGEDLAAYMRDRGAEAHDEVVLDIDDRVRTAVRSVLQDWRNTRDRFTSTPAPDPKVPHTYDQLMKLEGMYPTTTLPPYERVRQAMYRAMTPEDVQLPGRKPGPIQRSYDRAVIPEQTLRKAVCNDLAGFKKDTEGGGFVNPSQAIIDDLVRKLTGGNRRYQGRVLECLDEDPATLETEGFEAWLTADMSPGPVGQTRRYLRKGETGKMHYNEAPTNCEKLAAEANLIIRFDTIRGDNRRERHIKGPSGARLFPKYTAEVMRKNQRLFSAQGKPKMMLYALRDLQIWSPNRRLPHLENRHLPLGSNLASPKFFTDRGFVDFASDSHPRGPHAVHYVDGEPYYLRPSWVHLIGDLDDVHELSSEIWRNIQWKHGDYSPD